MAETAPKEAPKEEAPKVYLGFLPKEEIGKCIENFKKALADGEKAGDKKGFELEIKGTNEEPKGVSFETYSITKDNYKNFVDESKDYMAKALSVFTVSINAKDEAGVKILEELFTKFVEPFVGELKFVKKHPENYEVKLRTSGLKVSVDFLSVKGEFLQPLLDLNLNVSEFHNFKASFKSEFVPEQFFTLPSEELALKVLQLILSVKGESTNARYILTALIKALKQVKLANAKFQTKLEKHVEKLSALNAFVSFAFNFEFDSKELCGAGLAASKVKKFDINAMLEYARMYITGTIESKVVPKLKELALFDTAKATDIDEVAISLVFPKYGNGIAHVIKLPGFSKAFSDKFLK
jgi:hypothetical protein